MRSRDALELDCVGTTSVVPRDVFAPVEPFLLANAVAAETLSKDRVLDVGTGSGINAIVGAARSADVVAVDNNPHAVECARLNARRRYHNP
jgi:release factor glutamine methyltransferase